MKKLLIALLILLPALFVLAPAEAAGETFTSGDFEYILLEDGTAQITDYTGAAEALEIPAELDGHAVTGIGDRAFAFCGSLTAVTIPDSVTDIGANPFAFCDALEEIAVSADHPSLAVVDGVLFSRPDMRLVSYPSAFTAGTYAIPQGTRIIGDYAFPTCYRLTSVTIPKGVTDIGDFAFYGCISLASMTIPESVTVIGAFAFYTCASLTSVTIPEGVSAIGDGAFYDCESLTTVTLPDSLTDIGINPFAGCHALEEIIVSPDHSCLTIIDGALISSPDMRLICDPRAFTAETYAIPRGIRIIGDSAFSDCGNLTSVTIPEGVTAIGKGAFFHCGSLTAVTIPDGVTAIGDNAFDDCESLTSATVPDSVTAIGENAFYGCPDLILTVGRGSYAEEYCAANGLGYTYADAGD